MIDLKNLISTYPECLESKEKLRSFLNDMFPTSKRLNNVVVDIYESGIANQMRSFKQIDEFCLNALLSKLNTNFGVVPEYAYEGILCWAAVFDLEVSKYSKGNEEISETIPDISCDSSQNGSNSNDLEWRKTCELFPEYNVSPENYPTYERYINAVNKIKYAWRLTCKKYKNTRIKPRDYETEEEYIAAVEHDLYGWRELCEDFSAYGVCPKDYESKKEYYAAYERVKYYWRDRCTWGREYGIYAHEYQTEEEYNEACRAAQYRNLVRKFYYDMNIDPTNYNTPEELFKACEEVGLRHVALLENLKKTKPKKSVLRHNVFDPDDLTSPVTTDICGVVRPNNSQIWYYTIDGIDIKVGDWVVVRYGIHEKESVAMVVSIGKYHPAAIPFLVDSIEKVIRKAKKSDIEKFLE